MSFSAPLSGLANPARGLADPALPFVARGALAQLGERRLCKPEVTGPFAEKSARAPREHDDFPALIAHEDAP